MLSLRQRFLSPDSIGLCLGGGLGLGLMTIILLLTHQSVPMWLSIFIDIGLFTTFGMGLSLVYSRDNQFSVKMTKGFLKGLIPPVIFALLYIYITAP